MNETTGCDTLMSLLSLLFLIVMPIIISIIGSTITYQNIVDTCSNSVINLPIWIYVSSSIGTIASFIGLAIPLKIADNNIPVKIFIIILSILYAFLFIWNIVGISAFFIQLQTCLDMDFLLKQIMLSILICQWITFITFVIVIIYIICHKRQKYEPVKELIMTNDF
jgi:fatty acid desaturase